MAVTTIGFPQQKPQQSALPTAQPLEAIFGPKTVAVIGATDKPGSVGRTLMVKFHQSLSEESLRFRYFTPLKRDECITHERLARLCFIDYDREMVLIGQHQDHQTEALEIVGFGRLSKAHGLNEAECAIVISDAWHHRGLGTQLLQLLVQIARAEKLARLTASILPENQAMQQLCGKAGFNLHHFIGSEEYQAEMKL